MKLSKGLQSFWGMAASYLVLAIAISGGVFWRVGWLQGLVAIAGLILIGQGLLASLKGNIIQSAAQSSKPEPVDLASLPASTDPWLDQQILTLEGLGFQRVLAYRIKGSNLVQVFSHAEELCFVEIGQLFPAAAPPINHLVIISLLDQGWKLANINRLPGENENFSYIWRHPKTIVRYNAPNTLSNFLHNHLRVRQQMLSDLNTTVLSDLSAAAYESMLDQNRTHMLRTLERKNFLISMVEATQFGLNPKTEWLGDYAKSQTR